ncbi:MAG: hypothetical protein ABI207_00095, partial [Crocinitomicaceae bacterium]
MKYFTLLITSLFVGLAWSQVPITPKLTTQLSSISSQEKVHIRIEFFDNVDCLSLKESFNAEKLPASERPKKVITALQGQSQLSQTPVLAF